MVYRRPFSIVLEESLEGSEIIEGPATEPLEDTELAESVEEATELQAEITQDSGEVNEALEEAEALSEQADATDEVLAQTADEEGNTSDEASAITEEQVVTAEESFKWSLAKLGAASGYAKVVEVARESIASSKTRRERLKICNEGVKETIAKTIRVIINYCKKIVARIILFVKKYFHSFMNYKEKIKEGLKKIENIDKPAETIDAEDLAKTLAETPSIELATVVSTSSVDSLVTSFGKKEKSERKKAIKETVEAIKATVLDMSKRAKVDMDKAVDPEVKEEVKGKAKAAVKKCAEAASDDSGKGDTVDKLAGINGLLSGNDVNALKNLSPKVAQYGRTVIGFNETSSKLESVSLDFGSNYAEKVGGMKVDVNKLVKSILNNGEKMKQGADAIKKVADDTVDTQKKVEKELESISTGHGFVTTYQIQALKSIGIDLSMADFNEYITEIKACVKVVNAVAAFGTGKKKKDKK